MVTLGARWPLLCHPFVLYIGKTWPSHGPNMAHFKSDVISVKNFKKFKNEFRVKFGARVKIKLQIVFKTINLIYPENLGLSGLFLSKKGLHEIDAPNTPIGTIVYNKLFFLKPGTQNIDSFKMICRILVIFLHFGGFYSQF